MAISSQPPVGVPMDRSFFVKREETFLDIAVTKPCSSQFRQHSAFLRTSFEGAGLLPDWESPKAVIVGFDTTLNSGSDAVPAANGGTMSATPFTGQCDVD